MRISKVLPIQRVINETKRRRDDYDWDGHPDKAKLESKYLEELKDLQEKGELWYPNF
tara:strand:- start:187 stop:357 length:171 start_codon:yes stop_codon:yes gene_type:complete